MRAEAERRRRAPPRGGRGARPGGVGASRSAAADARATRAVAGPVGGEGLGGGARVVPCLGRSRQPDGLAAIARVARGAAVPGQHRGEQGADRRATVAIMPADTMPAKRRSERRRGRAPREE